MLLQEVSHTRPFGGLGLKEIRKNTGIISNVLRAIARSNSASMMRARGVRFTEDGAKFPER